MRAKTRAVFSSTVVPSPVGAKKKIPPCPSCEPCSGTSADIARALLARRRCSVYRAAKEHRRLLYKARQEMAKIRRGVRLRAVLTPKYMAKIPVLLNAAAERGVRDISVRVMYGSVRISGRIDGKDVAGHIWADLRGPVLDFVPFGTRFPTGSRFDRNKPLLRLKAFRKLYIEDRRLDMILGDAPLGHEFTF